jgi:hypothetical protein
MLVNVLLCSKIVGGEGALARTTLVSQIANGRHSSRSPF